MRGSRDVQRDGKEACDDQKRCDNRKTAITATTDRFIFLSSRPITMRICRRCCHHRITHRSQRNSLSQWHLLLILISLLTPCVVSLGPSQYRKQPPRSQSQSIPNNNNNLNNNNIPIDVVEGPFNWSLFAIYWNQQQPVLLKQAFSIKDDAAWWWPSWKELLTLAQDDHVGACSTRLIQHVEKQQLDTFQVDYGPLTPKQIQSFENNNNNNNKLNNNKKKQTIVINDVDRHVPRLADWMDTHFATTRLPRWRRDDAQVSCAQMGGGIGPHVDNYDVFLLQLSGQRQWSIDASRKLSIAEEQQRLVANSPIRILEQASKRDRFTDIILHPGDCLYLPPRMAHWGTAVSDECMTLSVGCRAPSAADLLVQLTETTLSRLMMTADDDSAAEMAHRRFIGSLLCRNETVIPSSTAPQLRQPSLTTDMKQNMKKLVLDAIQESMDNDKLWDELVGSLVTRPLRYIDEKEDYDNDEHDNEGIVEDEQFVWKQVLKGKGMLHRAPGISLATSQVLDGENKCIDRLYASGQLWELENDSKALMIFNCIESGQLMGQEMLQSTSADLQSLLLELIAEGILYHKE
jgi:50S ribosomal protein L16 3-hydroxylase